MTVRCTNGTLIRRDRTGSLVVLADGAMVFGAPHDSDGYRETARRIGYGVDTTGMCRDHDPLHALLADLVGLPESPSLRAAAGGAVDGTLAALDEAATLAVQRYMRAAGGYLRALGRGDQD